ncbi:hypothetical protein AL542_11865 [Grimontia hollisae]|uniref:Sce7726 family protein n=1 Tax=Grimontia hollisae TaxID=673 RepID=A0A377HJC2_GRIHO|nr:sce7726 family protein [Grimontia hollisae]AMG30984.1 hypothetical protein AL542_11865 [Grimontia hollisae]STO46955.1 Uncharacterised protein [Grimontia hollisae]STO56174.1 Uncharacterised protein [Grimontia hollisae]
MNDIDVRTTVHNRLLKKYHEDADSIVVDEFGLGQGVVRADIVVVNGILHGYELKSAKDNLKRLPQQVALYSATLDKATLVVSNNHLQESLQIIPSWWGVKVIEPMARGGFKLRTARRDKKNPSVDLHSLAQLLWRDETLKALEMCGITTGVQSKPRWALWEKLVEAMPYDQLHQYVRVSLKSRTDWKGVSRS